MKRELMVDLETMGTSADAPVVAIGAVYFDAEGLHGKFYRAIDLADAALYGKMDPRTVKWWLQQEHEARAQLYLATCPLKVALNDFAEFAVDAKGVWGFGATFDNVILRNAYTATGIPCPWSYRQDRCFRTLDAMHPTVDWPKRTGTHHHALDDAITQAEAARRMLWAEAQSRLEAQLQGAT